MRKTIVLLSLVALAACTKKVVETTVTPEPNPALQAQLGAQLAAPLAGQLGAATAPGAVEAFLVAVKAQDLRGMSAMWGNDKGPTADHISRDELEKRLIVMQCLLSHDRWQFAEDRARLVTGGRQEYMVDLWKKSTSGRTKFTTVAGKGGRWFVEDIDLAPLKEFCR